MPSRLTESTTKPDERVLLIGVEIYNEDKLLSVIDSLDELTLLAQTAGLEVVGREIQKLKKPNPKTLIGTGKVEELRILVDEMGADMIIFDEELSPRHQRELEKIFQDIRILDRTAVILDIFAQHASTREGALQVELAQYEYRLPRLTRAWTHLARQAGGGGGRAGRSGGVGLRGPGETQLEVDRREINRRINHIKQQLEKVRVHRKQHRSRRKQSRIPVITLVGYTNAGKSTLLNYIANSDVFVADQLFATLDPTTRRVKLPGGNTALFTDTVGFIQKLPTNLVAAFRATLEEISEADLLLHVIDSTHINAQSQAEAVHHTLREIGADHIPVLSVLNKIDCLNDPSGASNELKRFQEAVAISAITGEGVPQLLDMVNKQLFENFVPLEVTIPYDQGHLISQYHSLGIVDNVNHIHRGVMIKGKIPGRLLAQFQPYNNSGDSVDPES